MATLNPYLNFNGNTEEAFNFYKSVFGGELFLMRFKDTPQGEKMPEADKEKLMHASLKIGNTFLMATDVLESQGQKVTPADNFSIAITPENKEEADKLFNGLSAGGKVLVPMEKASWGAYFGMLIDKFGIRWMVNL